MTVQDLLLEAFTIAVCLKTLMSFEDFLMAHNWFSVKLDNCLGPIRVNIRDAEGTAVRLEFPTLADYKLWINNHIKAAKAVPDITDDEE